MKKYYLPLVLFFGTLTIYLFLAGRFSFSHYQITSTNYFILLADSFLHQKLYLMKIPSGKQNDLSFFGKHAYLYWPPLPAITMIPLVYFLGTNLSDVFILSVLASFSPMLIFLILHEIKRNNFSNIDNKMIILLSLFFAFGTCYFSISLTGTVWFTSQIVAILNFLLTLMFSLRFYRTKKLTDFVLCSFFLAMITFTRLNLLLSLPLFTYLIIKTNVKYLKYFFIPLLFCLILLSYYNYQRFGSFFETGLTYHNMNSRFRDDFTKYGPLNIRYFPHNFIYTIVNPLDFNNTFPFIKPDPEGNSIFLTSPLFLLLLYPFIKKIKINTNRREFVIIILVSFLLISGSVLSYLGSGWFQFGSRYLLDSVPLAIILLAIIIPRVPPKTTYFLFFLSVLINTLGALWLLSLSPGLYF